MKQFFALLPLSFSLLMALPAVAGNHTPLNGGGTPVKVKSAKAEWSKEEDLINGTISKSKLASMKAITSELVNFLKDSCISSDSYNPTWHGEYFSGKNSPGPILKFGMTCHFADQNADLSITANDIQPLLSQLVINGQHFLTMRIADAIKKNALCYTDARGADANGAQTKLWLVTTANDEMPFIPVTRKEYLQEAREELTTIINSIQAGWKLKVPVRPADVQAFAKKAEIDQLRAMYTGGDLDVRVRIYLRNYKTDEEYQQENIDKEAAGLKSTVRLMDSLGSHLSAAELAKPAVVSVTAADFNGFEDGQSNYMLIRMNNAYFNTGLSEEKPQVFLVTWHYDATNAATAELDRQLTERFDGQKLQEMLGK